jgi:hypothetical protein
LDRSAVRLPKGSASLSDAAAQRKLDALLAGQDAARERDEALAAQQAETHGLLRQVIQGVAGLVPHLAALREAVDALAEAANKEAPAKGKDLAEVLQGILKELQEQKVHLGRVAEGLERLPGIMERTAVDAAAMATGDGAGRRPKP